ncbi:MAG: hypothetical protein K2Y23_23380 [Cyanobacteria bacterium]|nr:hypothetical protein [Cyanobacteriota bacterium]
MAPAIRPRRLARASKPSPAPSFDSLAIAGAIATNPLPAQQHEHEQDRADRRAHAQRGLRQRRHGHRQRAFTAIAARRDADLPRARPHQPEMSGEHSRIFGRSLCAIRNRGELRAGAAERQRHYGVTTK